MFQGLQEDQLAGALEAMLFVTDEPVGTIALAEMLECEVGAVEAALVRLRDDLEARGSGIQLREVAGGWRLFTHPAYHELIEKYGDVRYCEGMPAPDATNPAFIIWNPREKTPLLPYDVDEAIALNQQRGDLGTMFESEEDLKVFDEGTIGRDELKMKHGSVIELMRATRNDMA